MKRMIQFVPSVKTKNHGESLLWLFKNNSIINDVSMSLIALLAALTISFAGVFEPKIAAATGRRASLNWKTLVETRLPESQMDGVVIV
jgi:hypothetical protein